MSDIQSNATTTLYINGKPAQDELNRLRNTIQDYRKQLVEVAADSKRGISSAEWKRLTNEIKSTEKELKSVQSGVASVSQVLLRLDKATPKELKNTLSQLKKELENIERGSKAWNAHVEKIKAVKAELAKLKEETKEHESLWSRFAKKVRKKRPWMSRKFFASFMNIKEFMAESLGREFCGLVADALDSDKMRKNSDFYKNHPL